MSLVENLCQEFSCHLFMLIHTGSSSSLMREHSLSTPYQGSPCFSTRWDSSEASTTVQHIKYCAGNSVVPLVSV